MILASQNTNGVTKAKLNAIVLRTDTPAYPHIIAIQEAKRLAAPTLSGYFSISNLTHSQHGVITYLRRDVRVIKTLVRTLNQVAAHVEVNGEDFLIVNIYNPHSLRSEICNFSDTLLSALQEYSLPTSCVPVIAGDFNYDISHKPFIDFQDALAQLQLSILGPNLGPHAVTPHDLTIYSLMSVAHMKSKLSENGTKRITTLSGCLCHLCVNRAHRSQIY